MKGPEDRLEFGVRDAKVSMHCEFLRGRGKNNNEEKKKNGKEKDKILKRKERNRVESVQMTCRWESTLLYL